MFRRCFLTFGVLVLMTACIPATSTLLPTLVHIPDTATPSASPSPEPSILSPIPETASPTLPEASPTLEAVTEPVPSDTPLPLSTQELPGTPELLATPTATAVPQPASDSGAIQFLGPGPLSKVTSPFRAFGYAVPGYKNKGVLELYGEDGRLLASQLLQLNTPFKWAIFSWEVAFRTAAVGELGRLTLRTEDEYGRISSVNSVHILLLSEGPSIINPPGNLSERCVIEQPVAGQPISGGVFSVVGKMRPNNNLPLTVELVARDGSVIGNQDVSIPPIPGTEAIPFRVDVHYNISAPMWGLLQIGQADDRIDGLMYLYSQEFLLNP